MKRPAAWPAMARAISVNPHRHLGAVQDGSLHGVGSLLRDERLTEALDAQRFLTLRTRIGMAGFYVEQPRTMALSTSDFSSLHNGRVMDKACRIAYNALVQYVNRDWMLDSSGHIAESEAKAIEEYVKQGLANGMLSGSPESRNVSDVDFIVSRTDDVLATQTLTCKTRVQPKGYSHFIENDIGFTKAFVAAPS
jgi:hypothetical protein